MTDSQGCAYQRLFHIQNRSAADYAFAVVQHNGLAGLPLPALALYQIAWAVLAMIFPLIQRY